MPENDTPPPDLPSKPAKSALLPGESKAAYVRRVGQGLRPFQVVQRARMDGVELSLNYVARVRSMDKKAQKPAATPPSDSPAPAHSPTPKRRGRPRKASPTRTKPTPPKPASTAEAAFRAAATTLILDHGIARATEILDDVVARLRAAAMSGQS